MIDLESCRQQPVLRHDHVAVAEAWKPRVRAVARFGRLAVADAVRQHYEIAAGIERLAGAEELAREFRAHEVAAAGTGAMKDQYGISHNATLIAPRLAERAIVDP